MKDIEAHLEQLKIILTEEVRNKLISIEFYV